VGNSFSLRLLLLTAIVASICIYVDDYWRKKTTGQRIQELEKKLAELEKEKKDQDSSKKNKSDSKSN
jgi:type III secretory pathway component EscU